jgi:hypothetical protein
MQYPVHSCETRQPLFNGVESVEAGLLAVGECDCPCLDINDQWLNSPVECKGLRCLRPAEGYLWR